MLRMKTEDFEVLQKNINNKIKNAQALKKASAQKDLEAANGLMKIFKKPKTNKLHATINKKSIALANLNQKIFEDSVNKKLLENIKIKKPSLHQQILQALKECEPIVKQDKESVTLVFDKVRLYTLNQLFAVMQYHKYTIFAYKKACHHLICKAVEKLDVNELQPPFKIYLYRRGKKKVDNDALSAMFKFFIDGLMESKLISDDNPDIIQEYILLQENGENKIALKLVKTQNKNLDFETVFAS